MKYGLFALVLAALVCPSAASAQSALEAEAEYSMEVTAPVDDMPDPFSIVDTTGVTPGSVIQSMVQQVKGIDTPVTMSITGGGTFSFGGGVW